MPGLRSVMAKLFPESSLLDGSSVGPKGTRFSIQLNSGEEAVGINLDRLENWPSGRKRCDALFVCTRKDADDFVVVLVELKGSHTEKAIEQIRTSKEILCRTSEYFPGVHCPSAAEEMKAFGRQHQRTTVLGLIVSTRSPSLRQPEKKKLQNSVRLRSRKPGHTFNGLDELLNLFASKK